MENKELTYKIDSIKDEIGIDPIKFIQVIKQSDDFKFCIDYVKDNVIKIQIKKGLERPKPQDIVKKCCEYFDIPEHMFLTKKRDREYVELRRACIRLLLEFYPNKTLSSIGNCINRDHASVMHHKKDMEKTWYLKQNDFLRSSYYDIYLLLTTKNDQTA